MITCFFGVPGCGKTTMLAKIAIREAKRIKKGRSKYKGVYTNFYCAGCNQIDFKAIEEYKLYNCLILFDEITMDADNRKFKSFSDGARDWFILHRHVGCDIIYATQSYELVDLKIRQLTHDLWYMDRTVVPFFRRFTRAKRIYRQININEHTSELSLGYRFCNLIEKLFTSNNKVVYRPSFYKYFNSFEEGKLEQRKVYKSDLWSELPVNKVLELLNSLEEKSQLKIQSFRNERKKESESRKF